MNVIWLTPGTWPAMPLKLVTIDRDMEGWGFTSSRKIFSAAFSGYWSSSEPRLCAVDSTPIHHYDVALLQSFFFQGLTATCPPEMVDRLKLVLHLGFKRPRFSSRVRRTSSFIKNLQIRVYPLGEITADLKTIIDQWRAFKGQHNTDGNPDL